MMEMSRRIVSTTRAIRGFPYPVFVTMTEQALLVTDTVVNHLDLELAWIRNATVFTTTQHNSTAPYRKDDFVVNGVSTRRILFRIFQITHGFVDRLGLCFFFKEQLSLCHLL